MLDIIAKNFLECALAGPFELIKLDAISGNYARWALPSRVVNDEVAKSAGVPAVRLGLPENLKTINIFKYVVLLFILLMFILPDKKIKFNSNEHSFVLNDDYKYYIIEKLNISICFK